MQALDRPNASAGMDLGAQFRRGAVSATAETHVSHCGYFRNGFPSSRMGANLAADGKTNWGISPHPVLLPMGEGQDEGRFRR
jgi:hypothetical protein